MRNFKSTQKWREDYHELPCAYRPASSAVKLTSTRLIYPPPTPSLEANPPDQLTILFKAQIIFLRTQSRLHFLQMEYFPSLALIEKRGQMRAALQSTPFFLPKM